MRISRTGVLLGALLAAGGTAHAESTLQTVLKRGQFLAGIVADSPPSAYLDAQGHQIGYCADVARYLAQRLGVKLQFVPVTAASRVPLLTTGRIDAEVSVTTPNKVRNEVVDFTYSYIWDEGVLMARTGSSIDFHDYLSWHGRRSPPNRRQRGDRSCWKSIFLQMRKR